MRADIGRPDVALIVADATHPASLAALCEQARVVVSAVGPYAPYGEPLTAAGAACPTGSHNRHSIDPPV